jgi:hypothetical protein
LSERIMLRANRFALAAALDGAPLEPAVWALHGCDNPVCVRVSQPGETGLLRVVGGSQRDNVLVMARAGRGGGRTMVGRGQAGLAQRRARAAAALGLGGHPACVGADLVVQLEQLDHRGNLDVVAPRGRLGGVGGDAGVTAGVGARCG